MLSQLQTELETADAGADDPDVRHVMPFPGQLLSNN
ncbi:Uncharacterised protein [Mycobacteroides abscessus subsp. abscessus]|nr:Uncharacterised protein [Mycobacteroides abscessus subsp. abscessus]